MDCFIDRIKSTYITNIIFSHVSENKLLSLFNYNKYLQKKFNFSFEKYQKVSGRYKIIEPDGKGKEYYLYTNVIRFEGEYLKGKRNGKGIEYFYEGQKKFEGEYSQGKKISGIEYNISGDIILTFQNGKGEEKYNNGQLQFKGEYYNGVRYNGKVYNINGIEEYEIKNGIGSGIEYDKSGKKIFEGKFYNGLRKSGKEYDDEI